MRSKYVQNYFPEPIPTLNLYYTVTSKFSIKIFTKKVSF